MKSKLIVLFIFFLSFSLFVPAENPRWGVGFHSVTGATPEHQRAVDQAAAIGIQAFRDDLTWTVCEQQPGVIDIPGHVMENIDYALEKGLEPLLILDYGHHFYDNGLAPQTKEGIEAYVRYVRTVVSLLRGRVKYFEVWNEPNLDKFWTPESDPKAYARLLKAAGAAIREENPDAVVVGGALSEIDLEFLEAVFEEGAYDSLDVVSVHPYFYPDDPENKDLPGQLKALTRLCQKYGPVKPIWITEVGVPTHEGGGATLQRQADMLTRSFLLCRANRQVESIFWYWLGPDGPDAKDPEHRFGLLNPKRRHKPSYSAYATLIEKLSNAQPVNLSPAGENDFFTLSFEKGNGNHLKALWKQHGTREVYSTQPGIVLTVASGREIQMVSAEKPVLWSVCPSPVFLETGKEPLELLKEPVSGEAIQKIQKSSQLAQGSETILSVSPAGNTRFRSWQIQAPDFIDVESFTEPNKDSSGSLSLGRIRVKPDAPLGRAEATLLLYEDKSDHPFARLVYSFDIIPPVKIRISPLPPVHNIRRVVLIDARNESNVPLSGTLEVRLSHLPENLLVSSTRKVFTDLPPQGSVSFPVTLRGTFPIDQVIFAQAIVTTTEGPVVQREKPVGFYKSLKKAGPIIVDGALSDWSRAESIRIDHNEQIVFEQKRRKGNSDFSATVRTCWDEEFLYISAEVADDIHAAPYAGEPLYKNDGLEFLFDLKPFEDQNTERFNEDDAQYGLFDSPSGGQIYRWAPSPGPLSTGRIAVAQSDNVGPGKNLKGFVIEAAVPFKELGFEPKNGRHVGFTIQLTDNDAPDGPASTPQQRQMSWTGRPNAWRNPRNFADLFFVNPQMKGDVQLDGSRTLVDGREFIPFGFWTFGQSEEGFRRLEQLGANTVAVAWPWAELEPKEGKYDNEQMDRYLAFLDLAHKYGQKVLIQFDIHVEPEWLGEKYPVVRPVDAEGLPVTSNFMKVSLTDPTIRRKIHQLMAFVARAVREHPAVLAYSPWNEPSFRGDMDFSPSVLDDFKRWSQEHTGLTTIKKFDLLEDVEDLKRLKQALFEAMKEIEDIGPVSRENYKENREHWLLWMRYRQNSFARFFQWWRSNLKRYDNNHPMALKLIWKPLDSRYAWESGANYDFLSRCIDLLGSDPYPHPGEFFINRWISDWNRSVAPKKPRWFLEYNRAFVHEYGLPRAEEIRSNYWQSALHGMKGCLFFYWPMQPFDPERGDNVYALLKADDLSHTEASAEIRQIKQQLDKVQDYLVDSYTTPADVAILHDWNTLFQMPGDKFPTAGATTLAQMLYQSHIPVDYISNHLINTGQLKNYKVLIVAGTVAPDDKTLERIKQFLDAGGAVIATARFAERNEYFEKRQVHPPEWFGCRVTGSKTIPREKVQEQKVQLPLYWNSGSTGSAIMQRPLYSATPVTLESGKEVLGAGPYFGFEDMELTEEILEQIDTTSGQTIGAFPDGTAAVVETDNTLYIGRDPSYSDDNWRRLVRDFIMKHGVRRAVWVTDAEGKDLGHVDAGLLWRPDGSALLILVNSPRLYTYNGDPVDITVHLGRQTAKRKVFEVETNQNVPLVDSSEGAPAFQTNLTEGRVRLYRLLPNQ